MTSQPSPAARHAPDQPTGLAGGGGAHAWLRRLEQAAQERDPLADALQQDLARESREAYLNDWWAFARWLEVAAGSQETPPRSHCPHGGA